MKPIVHVAKDEAELVGNVRRYLTEKLSYLLEQNGTVGIGVSGGSMPKIFCKALLSVPQEIANWKRIRIFMVDERNVELDSEDSNQGEYYRLIPHELQEIIIPVPIYKDVKFTAQQYEVNLRKYLLPEQINNFPRFDIIFLGVGPDGHTASIFPGKERLDNVTELNWVSYVADSPKPPPARVTLTLHSLQNSKNTAYIITGRQKADVARAIYDRDMRYPATLARPVNDKITLFLDEDSSLGILSRESSPESDSPPTFEG